MNAITKEKPVLPLSKYLESGMAAVIAPHPSPKDALRFRSSLRGWRDGVYLAIDVPANEEFTKSLWAEMPLVLRFFSSGVAGGFHTTVMSWQTDNGPDVMFVRWPESYEALAVRKAERIDVRIPCRIWRDDPADAEDCELVDLSETGCAIVSAQSYESGALFMAEFSIPDAATVGPQKCKVQNVRSGESGHSLGCQFVSPSAADLAIIAFFVSGIVDRRRAAQVRRVLIVDSQPEDAAALVVCLETNGFDVVVAPGPIDGAYRLRLVRPEAVLVNDDIPGMRGMDFCRIIGKTPGLENVPVFIYGKDAELPALAKEAQLSGHFPSIAKHDTILREIQKSLRNL